jgi:hypothetical protein
VFDFAVSESAPFTGLKSRHVQSVELVNEAGQFGLVIRRDSKDLGTQKGMSNVSDANRTYEKSGFAEDEFQMQLVSHPEAAVAFELESLFREVNDFAWSPSRSIRCEKFVVALPSSSFASSVTSDRALKV